MEVSSSPSIMPELASRHQPTRPLTRSKQRDGNLSFVFVPRRLPTSLPHQRMVVTVSGMTAGPKDTYGAGGCQQSV